MSRQKIKLNFPRNYYSKKSSEYNPKDKKKSFSF